MDVRGWGGVRVANSGVTVCLCPPQDEGQERPGRQTGLPGLPAISPVMSRPSISKPSAARPGVGPSTLHQPSVTPHIPPRPTTSAGKPGIKFHLHGMLALTLLLFTPHHLYPTSSTKQKHHRKQ